MYESILIPTQRISCISTERIERGKPVQVVPAGAEVELADAVIERFAVVENGREARAGRLQVC